MPDSLQVQSPFYRVGVKCLIFDDNQKLLVVLNDEDQWEIPGGGWEHDETLEECVARELDEELGIKPNKISPIQFAYPSASDRGFRVMRLAVIVTVNSAVVRPGNGMKDHRFVDKEDLAGLPMSGTEGTIKNYTAQIWPPVA